MKKAMEVTRYVQERRQGQPQHVAAARVGMSERTARSYEQAGQLPSQRTRPHTWRTRPNPFEADWPWVQEQLERDPAVQGRTLFALPCTAASGSLALDPGTPLAATDGERASAAWARTRGDL